MIMVNILSTHNWDHDFEHGNAPPPRTIRNVIGNKVLLQSSTHNWHHYHKYGNSSSTHNHDPDHEHGNAFFHTHLGS
jgi:hypothetical protein